MANRHLLKIWLPIAIVSTIFCGLIGVSVQQVYRMSANDPQIQMAQDAARSLEAGYSLTDIVSDKIIDMNNSLAPFLIVYNKAGAPIESSATLNNKIPPLPKGVIEYTKTNGEDRITWQPQKNVRVAAVIVKYKDGYVLAGRSLREVEIREGNLSNMVLFAWIAVLLLPMLALILFEKLESKK